MLHNVSFLVRVMICKNDQTCKTLYIDEFGGERGLLATLERTKKIVGSLEW